MFANTGSAFIGLLIYPVFLLIGALILYWVIRSAVVAALRRHQLWLEEYRPATNPGPQPQPPTAPAA